MQDHNSRDNSRNTDEICEKEEFSTEKDQRRTPQTVKNRLEESEHRRNGTTCLNSQSERKRGSLMSNNKSTPDLKLSTQLSTSKEDHRTSDLFSGAEQSKTFISMSEHQLQMSAMEERISKLENLVWALYKELNGKIDSSAASTQIQIEELTALSGL